MTTSRAHAGMPPPEIKDRSPLENNLEALVRLLARQAARESMTGQLSRPVTASASPAQEKDDA